MGVILCQSSPSRTLTVMGIVNGSINSFFEVLHCIPRSLIYLGWRLCSRCGSVKLTLQVCNRPTTPAKRLLFAGVAGSRRAWDVGGGGYDLRCGRVYLRQGRGHVCYPDYMRTCTHTHTHTTTHTHTHTHTRLFISSLGDSPAGPVVGLDSVVYLLIYEPAGNFETPLEKCDCPTMHGFKLPPSLPVSGCVLYLLLTVSHLHLFPYRHPHFMLGLSQKLSLSPGPPSIILPFTSLPSFCPFYLIR